MMKNLLFILLAVFLVYGCHENPLHSRAADDESATDAAHLHEGESYTVYSEHFELFVEISPLIVGETSEILAHVTLLNGRYEPLRAGSIFTSLNVKYNYVEGSSDRPYTPGIFDLEIVPEEAGIGEIMFVIRTKDFTDTLFIDHLHVTDPAGDGGHSHAHAAPDPAWVTFTKELAWKSHFNIQKAEKKDFANIITASGEMLPMPGEKQNIVAKADGILIFINKKLVQGSHVKEGDHLFTISGKGMTDNNIQVEFNESQTNFEKSRNDFERHKKLFEENVISERTFIETRSRYINDSVLYFSLKESITGQGFNIYAQRSGYVHDLLVSEGQYVSLGMALATVSSNEIMLLRADVPQQQYGSVGRIVSTHFRTAYSERIYTLEELNGRLLAQGSSVAENNHYIPVFFEVMNDGSLLEGAFAEFYLRTASSSDQQVIPESALIEEQNNFYVYVQINGEQYEKRYVTLGDYDGINRAIVAGINPGEWIVTEGAMLIKTASMSTMPVHSHDH